MKKNILLMSLTQVIQTDVKQSRKIALVDYGAANINILNVNTLNFHKNMKQT